MFRIFTVAGKLYKVEKFGYAWEKMIVEFIGPLKKIAGVGELELMIDREMKLLEILSILPEPVKKRVLESSGKLSPEIIILVNGVEVKSLGLENISVKPSDKVALIPIIHGG